MNTALGFWKKANEVVALAQAKRGVVVMPTGVGKTTQTPQALYQAGLTRNGLIHVTVPKRVLAVELAARVAAEMNTSLGGLVGYQIRGESEVSRATRILFLTEGLGRAKIRANPTLKNVSAFLLDEFHMRTLMSDFNASLIERAQDEGAKAAFLLMSATIDAHYLSDHFQCGIVDGTGLATTYPITKYYVPIERNLFTDAAEHVAQLMSERPQGNGLVFMPGKAEIAQTIEALRRLQLPHVTVLPLHGDLEAEARHAPFVRRDGVTVTVATDIVETGATLPDIAWVVDSGLAREIRYNPLADVSSLQVVEIAQDRIQQRQGRCGRVQAGVYIGLFTEENYKQRSERTEAEIRHKPLRAVVLTIKSLGLSREGKALRLIDNPEKANWRQAKRQLQALSLIASSPEAPITEAGLQGESLGCDPREAAMLLTAARLGCLLEMAIAVASMQAKRLLYLPHNEEERMAAERAHMLFKLSTACDAWTSVQVVRAAERYEGSLGEFCRSHFVSYPALREVRQNSHQFCVAMQQLGYEVNIVPGSERALRQAICAGFPDRIFVRRFGDSYIDQEGVTAVLAHESLVSAEAEKIVAWDIREIETRRGKLRLITNAASVLDTSEENS